MVSELALLPSGRTLRRWDLATAVYVLASLAVGAIAGWQIRSLAELHRSLLEAADALAVVVGVAVALLPTVPLVAVYLPLRVARAREVAGLERKLAGPVDPMLVEHLAHAALNRVPYSELRHVSGRPWQDVEQGRRRPLAAAELTRLGLRPPAGWVDTGGGSEPDRG